MFNSLLYKHQKDRIKVKENKVNKRRSIQKNLNGNINKYKYILFKMDNNGHYWK